MGLTSEYLKFHPVGVFGLVTSSRCPPVYLSSRLVACGCTENVLIWNVATGLRTALLRGENSQVTFIALRPNTRNEIAVGYADGTIGVFNVDTEERLVLLQGHRRCIQTLSFNRTGTHLASGSLDCEIIVWDVVEECGLYRLKGHKDKITSLEFVSRPNEENDSFIISTSSDRTIKVWELATQHCQVTNIHHKAQINSMRIISDLVICASDDPQLRVFKLNWAEENRFEDGSELQIRYFGSLNRSGTDKTVFVKTQDNMILCHGLKGLVDIWLLNNDEEIKKRSKKRIKKLKRERESNPESTDHTEIIEETILQDRIKNNHLKPNSFSTNGKLKGFDIYKTKPEEYKIICQHSANQLQLHQLKTEEKEIHESKLGKISLPGHRDAPRAVQFSEDNRALVTGSNDSIKVWSVESCKCVRTVSTDPISCIEYCQGDRQVIAGSKNGSLLVFDIASAEIVQEVAEAHEGEIWQIRKHKGDWATVGTDGNLKLWKLDYKDQTISMSLKKTLKLTESALAVEFTNDKKFIAVSLLDSTVKIFYRDTLKFWNSLYGHQLPVNCLAASQDSTLMVTGSADRSVKLWGMDFADCHKSFIAHDKAVVSVTWVYDTHLFFSMGKDGEIKQWDGDSFQLIQKLIGHHDEINCGIVSFNGDMVCSVSKDKSIRLWERSEELVVLEEEAQRQREEEAKRAMMSSEVNAETVIPGVNPDSEATINQVHPEIAASAAERLIESIEIHRLERAKKSNEPKHPILENLCLSPFEYVVKSTNDVHQQELESALLLLPVEYLLEYMNLLCDAIDQKKSVERVSVVLNALQRLFLPQLTSSGKYATVLRRADKCSMNALEEIKSVADFNFAILALLQDRLDTRSEESLFSDAIQRKKSKDNKRQKKSVVVI